MGCENTKLAINDPDKINHTIHEKETFAELTSEDHKRI